MDESKKRFKRVLREILANKKIETHAPRICYALHCKSERVINAVLVGV